MGKYNELHLGLDIGTNSVGWALLDENNNLIKKKGKSGFTFWGVRMFDEAEDAKKRREYRNSRRRLQRRKERINLLREIFYDEISNVDPTFFERLDDSFYKIEDKKYNNYYNLFTNEYTDKDFFTQFPTIYHLRKHIMSSNEKVDIRFLYLACHNIIKYRGNFLHSGDSFEKNDTSDLKRIFEEFNDLLINYKEKFEDYDTNDYFQKIELEFDDVFFKKLGCIIMEQAAKNEKKEQLRGLFNVEKKTLVYEYMISLLVDSPVSFEKLSFVKDLNYEASKLELSNVDILEDKLEEFISKCPDIYELIIFTANIKSIIDSYYLLKLIGDYNYLSEAMINQYEMHQEDLKRLKKFVKKYLPKETYFECFRKCEGVNNYAKYVGFTSTKGKIVRFSHCKRVEFYKYLKSLFDKVQNEEAKDEIEYFVSKINANDFLLRQNSDQNGSIPMQLHLAELKQMLLKQSKYYSFISELSNGLSNFDKIISIFKFKIPYYVGPLGKTSKYGWASFNSEEKVRPWNVDSVVDKTTTAERFINRMQNKCTYLKCGDNYCLPKCSLLYSEYECWSQINKIRVNGSLIDYGTKMSLFNDVFKKIPKPSQKEVKKFFDERNLSFEKIDLTCNMSSYVQFVKIFGKQYVDNNLDLIERIIKDITIFNDKSILETRLRNYKIEEDKIKQIKGLNFKDFGKLSKRFLSELRRSEFEPSIIEIMRETNFNLQEIIFGNEYNFNELIELENKDLGSSENSLEEFIDSNFMINPLMRRSMIQSVRIIDEIEKILNRKIDYYYIECNRSNKETRGEKGRKNSRYEFIKNLYNDCKNIIDELKIDVSELLDELENYKDNNELQSERLFLYFTQLGRCMYTLEPININQLLKPGDKIYDIDHIYPQSLIKDDSFNNKVLVKSEKNREKTDKFIFELGDNFLNKKCCAFYEMLCDKGLISKEKKRRLLKTEMTSGELEGFINRQIVSSSQSIKGLVSILKDYKGIPQSHIIMSKAENISEFRHEFNLYKSRTANNYHHAHDAYLNVVVGKALHKYFTMHNLTHSVDFIRIRNEEYDEHGEKQKVTLNIKEILKRNRYVNGKLIWNKDVELGAPNVFKEYLTKGEEKYQELIYDNGKIFFDLYGRFDISETTMTYNSHTLVNQVTIMPAGSGSVPIKSTTKRSNIEKYGGIKQPSYSHFIVVNKFNKKGVAEPKMIAIPSIYTNKVDEYLKTIGIDNYEIVVKNVKINDLIYKGNNKSYITGVTNSSFLLKNAVDRNFNYLEIRQIRMVDKYFENIKTGKNITIDEQNRVIILAQSNRGYDRLINFDEIDELFKSIVKVYSNKSFDYSLTCSILNIVEKYYDLAIVDKLITIRQLLEYLKTNERKTINLSVVGGKEKTGTLTLSTLNNGDRIIQTSYTGYYKNCLYEVK